MCVYIYIYIHTITAIVNNNDNSSVIVSSSEIIHDYMLSPKDMMRGRLGSSRGCERLRHIADLDFIVEADNKRACDILRISISSLKQTARGLAQYCGFVVQR